MTYQRINMYSMSCSGDSKIKWQQLKLSSLPAAHRCYMTTLNPLCFYRSNIPHSVITLSRYPSLKIESKAVRTNDLILELIVLTQLIFYKRRFLMYCM